ncbi:hypothetical protein BYT27DRAFT_7213193 [Phlegmacium glaucopus]|nr:hypothetical protein BYT27DRAFT_7213193 [Phlegmacium glaucopus]
MSAYVARVRHTAFLLEEADVKVSDDDIILAITSGLPHSYDPFLISLDATSDLDYTLPLVIARLVNEYQRQHFSHHHTRQQPTTSDQIDEAMAVTSSTPHQLMHITCFKCGKKGHYHANCPAESADKPLKIEYANFAEENDSEIDEAF